MIRGVIFDCFGVLYVDASKYFYEHHLLAEDYERLRPQLAELTRAHDMGFIHQAEFNQQLAELTGLPLELVAENITKAHIRNQKLLDYAQSLRSEYKVGLLSNVGPGAMNSFFSADERVSLFDEVVLSSEVGMVKPSPEIFTLMANRLGLPPEECLMIDDLAANITGATTAGMAGVVYHSVHACIADVEAQLATSATTPTA